MITGFRSVVALAVALSGLLVLPLAAHATAITYDLSFETNGQSIWDTGDSFMLNKKQFLGAAWQDANTNIDAIVGDASTSVPNPARVAYDAAFATCRLGFSASVCINGQSGRVPVPALGSRPRVRSCGRFAVACKIARGADLARRAAYDVAFAACRRGFSSSVCRNGQSARVPVPPLGTAPSSTLDLDTRTGFAVNGTTDGRVGLELGVAIDSGSVDATVSYQASLDIPDTTLLNKADPINFNPNSALAGTNTLNTSFSSIELSVDAIMELSGSVRGEACLIGPGCASKSTPFDIDETAPIISFNRDGDGEILVLGQTPSDLFLNIPDGFPVDISLADLVTATLHFPQPDASGGLDPTSQTLKASGQDDLLDLIVDLDNVVATAAGLPGLFGKSFDVGPGEVGFDIINVEMGPTIDLKQDFELNPTLFVELVFDQAVLIGGQLVTEIISAWDLLPDITFLSDTTTVTPTFFLDAELLNETLLDFDLQFTIDLLQIFWDFGILGEDSIGIGNILDQAIDLFQSPNLFSNLFPLGGFNLLVGREFHYRLHHRIDAAHHAGYG